MDHEPSNCKHVRRSVHAHRIGKHLPRLDKLSQTHTTHSTRENMVTQELYLRTCKWGVLSGLMCRATMSEDKCPTVVLRVKSWLLRSVDIILNLPEIVTCPPVKSFTGAIFGAIACWRALVRGVIMEGERWLSAVKCPVSFPIGGLHWSMLRGCCGRELHVDACYRIFAGGSSCPSPFFVSRRAGRPRLR